MEPEVPSGGERIRRNVNIAGRRTSVSLESAVWDALTDICKRERVALIDLFTRVDQIKFEESLASALRVFVLAYFRLLASGKIENAPAHGVGADISQPSGALARVMAEFRNARRNIARSATRRRD